MTEPRKPLSDRLADSAIQEGDVSQAGDALVKSAALDFAHGRVRAGIISTQTNHRAGRISRILSVQAGTFVIAQHFQDNLVEESAIRRAWKEIVGSVGRANPAAAGQKPSMIARLLRQGPKP